MKTPMQLMIWYLENEGLENTGAYYKAKMLLELEKEHIIAAANFLPHDEQNEIKTPEEYYNQKYQNK